MAGGIWAAALGYCFAFYNAQLQEQRKARIERVNLQLRDLYGPLLACVTATKSAYEAMIRQHSPDGSRAAFMKALVQNPDGPEARAYRVWMSSVLQPLNEKAADIVHGGFSLMEGSDDLEAEVLQLVAHVSASRVLLERWAQGELTTTSAISYPDRLEESVRHEFSRIKKRQAELLGVAPLVGPKKHWWGTSSTRNQGTKSKHDADGGRGSGQDSSHGNGAKHGAGIAIRMKEMSGGSSTLADSSTASAGATSRMQQLARQVTAAVLPGGTQGQCKHVHEHVHASQGCVDLHWEGSSHGCEGAGSACSRRPTQDIHGLQPVQCCTGSRLVPPRSRL